MALSKPRNRNEDGFATPAAAGVCLAIAVVTTAVMAHSVAELRRARADYDRTRTEYALDGAANVAEVAVLQSKPVERLAWALSTDIGTFDALAEAEAPKLSLADAQALDGGVLARLGVRDPSPLQARLTALSAGQKSGLDIAGLDAASPWKACGRSLVSPWGVADAPHLAHSVQPTDGNAAARIGEVWRIRVRSANGLTDDRVVRFTGDPARPAAIIERRLYRTAVRGDACDTLADKAQR